MGTPHILFADRTVVVSTGLILGGAAVALVTLAACGAHRASKPPEHPAAVPAAAFDGKCAFLGLDEVAGADDQNSDSVSLLATYRFGEGAGDDSPLSLGFRVARSRVRDLRTHLQAHPNVLCRPDPQGLFGGAAAVHVPPFEGQSGQLMPHPAKETTTPDAGSKPTFGASRGKVEDFMFAHFAIVTWGRDAVINGEVDALREPMSALSRYDYAHVAPGGWMSSIAQMQEAAKLTASAASLELAATGVATIARVCGDCHQSQHKGPQFELNTQASSARAPDTFRERMQRHIWASDRMWEGVTGPSDAAWNAGARALAELPAEIPSARPLPPSAVSALQKVRELGASAADATTLAQRADLYGLLLATCASCHAQRAELGF